MFLKILCVYFRKSFGCPVNLECYFYSYVDQEDHLLPTLTVYETILYSALLRLPRTMSLEAKKIRVLETMGELGILDIKDSKIGDSGRQQFLFLNRNFPC